MEQDRTETFTFNGKEYKVTPEIKRRCEQTVELIRTLHDSALRSLEGLLERTGGDIPWDNEVRRRLERVTEQAVASAGLDSPVADFLDKRS